LQGWQAGGKDTEHGLLAEVARWKAMLEEERTRHAAERARDAERAAAALEQERAAAAEQAEAQREQMRAMQAAMQSEMEWRASELERATKQAASEREASPCISLHLPTCPYISPRRRARAAPPRAARGAAP